MSMEKEQHSFDGTILGVYSDKLVGDKGCVQIIKIKLDTLSEKQLFDLAFVDKIKLIVN